MNRSIYHEAFNLPRILISLKFPIIPSMHNLIAFSLGFRTFYLFKFMIQNKTKSSKGELITIGVKMMHPTTVR